ncbi:hypothetical protein BLFGPEAP_00706 [Candidatus Methanoperedenaceae archaeon GB50]|nr:hypothetical protein BLFGPEAP_00706 [Candidatus Methanoperedenaceae archaeon GB50]
MMVMPIQWGWHEAENLWHDNAVQWGTFFNGGMENWNILTDKDMAFQIEVVPHSYYFIASRYWIA